MSLVAVVSAKGSPGTTRVACMLAGELASQNGGTPVSAFLVDADADGGDVALALGLDPAPGLSTLALAGRHGFGEELVLKHSQRSRLLPGVAVVPGIAGRSQLAVLDWLAEPLAGAALGAVLPYVVDAGRSWPAGPGRVLVEAASCVLLVTRAGNGDIVHCRSALAALAELGVEARPVLSEPPGTDVGELTLALGRPPAGVLTLENAARSRRRAAKVAGRLVRSRRGPAGAARSRLAEHRRTLALRRLAAIVLSSSTTEATR